MASRPTLGPEAERAVEQAMNVLVFGRPRPTRGYARRIAGNAVQEFLTEASQSCPELLLRYALSEEEITAAVRMDRSQKYRTGVDVLTDKDWWALDRFWQKLEAARRKLDHGERDG